MDMSLGKRQCLKRKFGNSNGTMMSNTLLLMFGRRCGYNKPGFSSYPVQFTKSEFVMLILLVLE
jgi:hypothetical protein